jgi:tRNA A-37 threonylcarbamoyl transferase component Bud32
VARDQELNREVALKEIRDEHADNPESRARFVPEAEVTGGLEHPGIVPVYGLGTYGDGRPYYAMRFIKGDSLHEAIKRFHEPAALRQPPGERQLELRRLLGRFIDVCNALAYAHSRGVLHRDLKPGNIMLGKYGETLVVDWGLAKALGQAEAGYASERPLQPVGGQDVTPTVMGSRVGTPAYMSPEQAAGRLDLLGPASDVYSLGATLYCLLTGKPPVQGHDSVEVVSKVERGEIVPPRQANPQTPPALAATCLKAMALKSEERYPNALALAADVEHWLADEPVSAWREPLSVRARRWVKQHRTAVTGAVAAVTVAALVLAGATVLLTAAYESETDARKKAEDETKAADIARKTAEYEKNQADIARKATDKALKQAKQELRRFDLMHYHDHIAAADKALRDNDFVTAKLQLEKCRRDLRHVEYAYLRKQLAQRSPRQLLSHTDWVHSLVLSADGKRLYSGSGDKTIKVWDFGTGK